MDAGDAADGISTNPASLIGPPELRRGAEAKTPIAQPLRGHATTTGECRLRQAAGLPGGNQRTACGLAATLASG